MAYFVADEKLQGYYVSGGVTINIVKYHFECDDAASLPAQTAFISSKNIKISMASTAHTLADNKQYEMNSAGTWVDITDNAGAYTLPPATANSLGGIIVGSGLSINSAGVLSADGGASMPYTNHNGGIRGKNLGSSYTAEQKAAIAAGTFDDIYVGDYWTFGGTVWRVVDIDTFYQHGDPRCTEHHAVIMPDEALLNSGFDSSLYGNDTIATTKLPAEAASLESIIGSYLIAKKYMVHKDTSEYYQWVSYKMMMPSFHNFLGAYDMGNVPGDPARQSMQFALFRYAPWFINTVVGVNYWCMDRYSSNAARVTHTRVCDWQPYTNSYGVRPFALLAGTSQ